MLKLKYLTALLLLAALAPVPAFAEHTLTEPTTGFTEADRTVTVGNSLSFLFPATSGGGSVSAVVPASACRRPGSSAVLVSPVSTAEFLTDAVRWRWTPDASVADRTCNFSLFLSDPTELNTPETTVIFEIIVNSAPPDTAVPAFDPAASIDNQLYLTTDIPSAIPDLTLPIATGGDGTLAYSIRPLLPAGLTLTGRILSGTLAARTSQASTAYTYRVSDTDSNPADTDTDTLTFTIEILNILFVPMFSSTANIPAQVYAVGTDIGDVTLPQGYGSEPLAYSIMPTLPNGLTLTGRTLSGTPAARTAQASTAYTYRVDDGDGSNADFSTLPFTIRITGTGVNICGRTAAVEAAILTAITPSPACIDVSAAQLASVTTLNLDDMVIATLQSGDFAGLTGLTMLDLSDNNIGTLPADIFDGLTALQTLLFNRNRGLTTLDEDIFDGLTALTILDLTDNEFTALPADIFDGLTALEDLNLVFNRLTGLPADIFDGLDTLSALDLSGNSFTAGTGLPAGIFDDVLDTFDGIDTNFDQNVRDAHFVCSRDDADAIVAATVSVENCLRISSVEFDTALVQIDATLSGLTLSPGNLNPAFDSAITTYTVSLGNVAGVIVMPTATNAGATITVNGDPVASGADSATIPLTANAPLDIPIIVTAADSATRLTYTVTATRSTMATVSGVAFTSTGPYALGEPIQVTVTFSENVTVTVTVTGTPEIALNVNGISRAATYISGSGSADLVFTYTVTAGETDANGVGINANAITTPGSSTIQNAGGNDAILTHVAVLQNLTHRVETTAPTLTGATVNGNSMVLTYNENLDPSSTPANNAYTIGVSGTGTATVTGTTISGAGATLALSAAVTRGLMVTVSYTPGSTPLQDTAGNDAARLTMRSVTNATPEPFGTIYTDDDIPATLDVGQDFSVDFDINHPDASGSGVRWSQTTNDCGIAHRIDGEGVLTFTPLVAQAESTCNFVVRFEDTTDRTVDTFEFTVSINAAAPAVPVASDGSRTVTEGETIAINLSVVGTAPVTCATTSPLPGGLTLNGAACTIMGDVADDAVTNGTLLQVFVIAYTATNTAGSDSGTYTLTVNALNSAPTFSGARISAQIYAVGTSIGTVNLPPGTGGDGALTYTITPLPSGLRLNVTPTGNTLTGTPAAGTEQSATAYTYTVSDSDVDTAATDTESLTFTITIQPVPEFTIVIADQVYCAGVPIPDLVLPEATGGTPELLYSLTTSRPLDPGLTFTSATRTLSGTPEAIQSEESLTYTVTDANNGTDDLTFAITVKEQFSFEFGSGRVVPPPIVLTEDTAPETFTGSLSLRVASTPTVTSGGMYSLSAHQLDGASSQSLTVSPSMVGINSEETARFSGISSLTATNRVIEVSVAAMTENDGPIGGRFIAALVSAPLTPPAPSTTLAASLTMSSNPLEVMGGLITPGSYALSQRITTMATIPGTALSPVAPVGYADTGTGLFDFNISGVSACGRVQVLIPLLSEAPADARLFKYAGSAGGWNPFTSVVGGDNYYDSASSPCPAIDAPRQAAGDAFDPAVHVWRDASSGTQAGARCLLLDISDGGINDADGSGNGIVFDPSGLFIRGGGGGGHGGMHGLWLLLLFMGLLALRLPSSFPRKRESS